MGERAPYAGEPNEHRGCGYVGELGLLYLKNMKQSISISGLFLVDSSLNNLWEISMFRFLAILISVFITSYMFYSKASAEDLIQNPADLLTPFDEEQLDRKGWFLNPEPENQWKKRLSASPYKLDKAFAVWDPSSRRIDDVTVFVCFNRKLRAHEKYYVLSAHGKAIEPKLILKYKDGSKKELTYYDLTNGFGYKVPKQLKDRCFYFDENSHPCERYTHLCRINVPTEINFRPDNLLSVSFSRPYKTKYRGIKIKSYGEVSITPLIAHIRTKCFETAHDKCKLKDVPVTSDFILGRIKGEAARYAQYCQNIKLITLYDPPAENDDSEYAQGFAAGWDASANLLHKKSSVCEYVLDYFHIPLSGIQMLLRKN